MLEAITTIATIPAILALVNLAKQFGVAGKWSTLLAVFLGIAMSAADYGFTVEQATQLGWYAAVATGLILGLSAAGLYDVARTVKPEPAAVTVNTSPEAKGPVNVTEVNLSGIENVEQLTELLSQMKDVKRTGGRSD